MYGMNKKLDNIVRYAYENVSYYSNREKINSIEEQWESLPILAKDEVVENQNLLLSNKCIAKYLNNQLHMEHTSGSTGKCFEVYWEESDYQRSLLPLYFNRRKFYGIRTDDKLCYFYTVRSDAKEDVEYIEKNRSLSFSKSNLNEEKLQKIYCKMKEFQPVWILGQPSVLFLLADVAIKRKLGSITSLRYIELTGEMLLPSVRSKISDVFNCPIANHYGTIEVSSIAYECPYGNMHLTDCTYTEIVDSFGKKLDDETEGEVCVTSLVNTAMPLIKYNVGDRAILHPSNGCRCGSKNKILKLTTGRTNEYILTEKGERINSYIFVRAVEVVNHNYPQAIKQFQVVQTDFLSFHVKLVIETEYDRGMILAMFMDNVWQDELKDAKYYFEFKESLFPSENGKLAYFINRI